MDPVTACDGRRLSLLGELLSLGIAQDGNVEHRWLGQAERSLKPTVPRQLRCEVVPSHDVGNTLEGVIYDHRQVVGPEAVCPLHHKVIRCNRSMGAAHPPGMRASGRVVRFSTGARVTRVSLELTSGTAADKHLISSRKVRQSGCVGCVSGALKQHPVCDGVRRFSPGPEIPLQAVVLQLLKNEASCTGLLSWRVEVFHAHQPLLAARPCIEMARERCDQRALMKGPTGGGCKAPRALRVTSSHGLFGFHPADRI